MLTAGRIEMAHFAAGVDGGDEGRHDPRDHRRPRGRGGACRRRCTARRRAFRSSPRKPSRPVACRRRAMRSSSSIPSTGHAPSSRAAPSSRSTSGSWSMAARCSALSMRRRSISSMQPLARMNRIEATIAVEAGASISPHCLLTRLATRQPDPAGARRLRQPLARLAEHRRVSAAATDRGKAQGELFAEVLSDRARRGGSLCPSRPNQRVGHRRRAGDPGRRGRQRDDARRPAARYGKRERATSIRISSPGRASRCCAARKRRGCRNKVTGGGPNGHTLAPLSAEGF